MRPFAKRRLLTAGAAVLLAAGGAGAVGGGNHAAAGPEDEEQQAKLAQAQALTQAPPPVRGAFEAAHPSAGARDAAARHATLIPLPEGGNFNGVRWEQAEGTVADSELRGVLEYNAACQWLRAWREGREVAVAAQILGMVPAWPALRGSDAGAVLREVAADDSGQSAAAAGVLADCQASHDREVHYARALGLTPSS